MHRLQSKLSLGSLSLVVGEAATPWDTREPHDATSPQTLSTPEDTLNSGATAVPASDAEPPSDALASSLPSAAAAAAAHFLHLRGKLFFFRSWLAEKADFGRAILQPVPRGKEGRCRMESQDGSDQARGQEQASM